MVVINCLECHTLYPNHKMDCGSKSVMAAYVRVLENMYKFSDAMLLELEEATEEVFVERYGDDFDQDEGVN